MAKPRRGVIQEFRKFLSVTKKTPVITLGEGDTPLVQADRLAREIWFRGQLWLKAEGANPTGSFKDRGMTVAISKAVEGGATAVICASTGNTLASAAAYSAKAGIKCVGLLPHGNVAAGKLVQAIMHGAQVIQVRGNFDDAARIAYYISENYPVKLVNSLNPHRLEGQKTAAFEICDQLGRAPDYHFIPVGNAGNITAYWMGYKEWCKRENKKMLWGIGFADIVHPYIWNFEWHPPKMMGYQAEGADPIVLGRPIEDPKTFATAIKVGNPARWKEAVAAAQESGGKIDSVSDADIFTAYKRIAAFSGIFCEPASAASVAGLTKAVRNGDIENHEGIVVVCTLTGNGLKDPDTAMQAMEEELAVLDADPDKVIKFLKL